MNKFYGNRKTVERLNRLSKEPTNVYLFKGPRGVGKATMAMMFAKLIQGIAKDLCSFPDEFSNQAVQTDIIYMSSHKKKDVTELVGNTFFKPDKHMYRFYIIDNADELTEQAQNALLKTLEESLPSNIFILVGHDNMLPTVESRSCTIDFKPISETEIRSYLTETNKGIGNDDMTFLMKLGSIGVIESLLNNQEVMELFSNTATNLLQLPLLKKHELMNMYGEFKEKDTYFESIKDYMYEFLELHRMYFKDLLFYSRGTRDISVFEFPHFYEAGYYDNLVKYYDVTKLYRIIDEISQYQELVKLKRFKKNNYTMLILSFLKLI